MNCVKIIKSNEYKTSQWSGGKTIELYIYPQESSYQKLDFLFRISSASVEVEESIFTHLPGIKREIMIIDGSIRLNHRNHYTKELNRFQKDTFSGEWETKGYGKVTDFNLMMNKNCTGHLEHIKLLEHDNIDIECYKDYNYGNIGFVLYCVDGDIIIDDNINLSKGDLFVYISDINKCKSYVNISSNLTNSQVIVSKVCFN